MYFVINIDQEFSTERYHFASTVVKEAGKVTNV
jgi:hypothetical protein